MTIGNSATFAYVTPYDNIFKKQQRSCPCDASQYHYFESSDSLTAYFTKNPNILINFKFQRRDNSIVKLGNCKLTKD